MDAPVIRWAGWGLKSAVNTEFYYATQLGGFFKGKKSPDIATGLSGRQLLNLSYSPLLISAEDVLIELFLCVFLDRSLL